MSRYPKPWMLCGGWAVDAWLGRQTREHGDVDITVFDEDQKIMFDHLRGWHVVADEDHVTREGAEPWDGRQLQLPAHLHCRPPGELGELVRWVTPPYEKSDGLNLEIMFNERSDGEFVVHREPRVVAPLDASQQASLEGAPTMVPELLMFFKATAYWGSPGHPRPHDEADFLALEPVLDDPARGWLHEAMSRVAPEHPWLQRLQG